MGAPFSREQWEAGQAQKYINTPDEVLEAEDAQAVADEDEGIISSVGSWFEEAGSNIAGNTAAAYDMITNDKEYTLNTEQAKGMAGTFGNAAAFSLGDEALAVGQSLLGNGTYEENVGANRKSLEDFARKNPELASRLKVAGMVTGGIATLPFGGPAATMASAAKQGATIGALHGFGEGEGTEESLTGLGIGATGGAVGGAVLSKVAPWAAEKIMKLPDAAKRLLYVNKAFKSITKDRGMLGKPAKVEQLVDVDVQRAAKDAAYQAVDDLGEVVKMKNFDGLYKSMMPKLEANHMAQGKHTQITNFLNNFRKDQVRKQGTMKISDVESWRQSLNQQVTNKHEQHLKRIVSEELDDMIHHVGGKNATGAIATAREAHRVYRTTELLDNAMLKAADRAKNSGSGGNIQNFLMQEVQKILDGKAAKYYTDAQRKAMRHSIEMGDGVQLARIVGKMAPGGNGLMTFLTTQFSINDPKNIALQVAAYLSKKGSEYTTRKNTQALLRATARGEAPPIPSPAMQITRRAAAKGAARAAGPGAMDLMEAARQRPEGY